MFTGLVETLGQIVDVIQDPPGRRLRVECGLVADGMAVGDSIAINGCCLTVVSFQGSQADFEAGEETLSRTNLGNLQVGSAVNLERALAVGDRMGGHYVSGHVDTLATLNRREEDPPWAKLWFDVPQQWTRQMAPKGSVTIDGVSLTLVDVLSTQFSVALIPHTLTVTTLGQLQTKSPVNIETDVLAKYVGRFLETQERWPNAKQPPT
ncbi:Riboflavin synthase [Roseimaritima multifibrata]|uniref:Riboflavin synthase n=1 Tax=Roseimaritima multifibrata TaxID=1930274 RepID=A0A517M8Y1_9BACT|nr:riboflavin synthase [Roseimaritima multifibrata]QDS91346.1 Riboflavin synthase [Roseimaritima multifibrata]